MGVFIPIPFEQVCWKVATLLRQGQGLEGALSKHGCATNAIVQEARRCRDNMPPERPRASTPPTPSCASSPISAFSSTWARSSSTRTAPRRPSRVRSIVRVVPAATSERFVRRPAGCILRSLRSVGRKAVCTSWEREILKGREEILNRELPSIVSWVNRLFDRVDIRVRPGRSGWGASGVTLG
eukprot:scaffold398_cov356-Pavlova_lutheri.AAC.11